jgi:hypothetical protein
VNGAQRNRSSLVSSHSDGDHPRLGKTGAIAALSSEMPFSGDFVRVLLLLMN